MQLTSGSELAHRELLQMRPMRALYTQVQDKHLSLAQNQTIYSFENVFTDNLSNLVIISLVADKNFAGHYNQNLLNFLDICINRSR